MKKAILASIVLLLVVGSFLFNKKESSTNKNKLSFGSSIGTESDRYARINFEKKKLVDPNTNKIPSGIRSKELAFKANLKQGILDTGNIESISWLARGPFNIGGRTRSFAMDISNQNTLLAGGVSGGMWKSTDGGSSWDIKTGADQNISVTCLAQDTRTGLTETWYYGTGEGYGASHSGEGAYFLGNGMYKSTDNGDSWESLSSTASNTPTSFDNYWDIIWNIATDPSTDTADVVYAATLGKIQRSLDGGNTWTSMIGNSSNYSYFTNIKVTPNGIAYATLSSDGPAGEKGIWRLNDAGEFINITPSNYPTSYDRTVLEINPNNPNELLFLAVTEGAGQTSYNWQGNPEYHSLWKYEYLSGNGDDTGGTWTDLSENIPTGPELFDDFSGQGGYDLCIAYDPFNDSNVVIGGTNVYLSTTAFTDSINTTQIGGYARVTQLPEYSNYPNHHPDNHVLFFDPNTSGTLYNANDGGLYKSSNLMDDTLIWESLNNGYVTTQFYHVAVDQSSNSSTILGGLQDNGTLYTTSNANDAEWTMPLLFDGGFTAIEDGSNHFYMATQNGRMIKSQLDAQGYITNYKRIDPIEGSNYHFINPFELDPVDNNIMYTLDGNKVWRNDDLDNMILDNSWDSISQGWTQIADSIPTPGYVYTSLVVSNSPAHRLYLGSDSRRVYRIDNAESASPELIEITSAPPVLFPTGYVNCVAVNPDDADHVMVAFSNYGVYSIFNSYDGGDNWEKAAGNLESSSSGGGDGPSVRWLSILPLNNGTMYLAGTSVGLFGTDTLMGTETIWSPIAEESIGNAVVEMIETRPSDGLVVVATHGKGVFSANITDISVVAGIKTIEFQPSVKIYPNPTSNTIFIEMEMEQNVNLFTVDGKFITTIKSNLEVNVANLSSGNYFLKSSEGTYIGQFTKL